jgi:hypothetical protein
MHIGSPNKKLSKTRKQRETKIFMKLQEELRKERQEAVIAAGAKEEEALMTTQATEDAIAGESTVAAVQAAEVLI